MKRLLYILFLFCSVIQAQTTWYIDPGGSDGSGDGTSGNPWATLYKATSTIPSIDGAAGDIIHVNAGTYNEYRQCILAPDISIEGEGYNSLIRSTYQNAADNNGGFILLSGGPNTAQHISNVRINGTNLTGYQAITIYGRDNVEIYNCFVSDFLQRGVVFRGAGSSDNKFHNNEVINCGGQPDHKANLHIAGQTDFLCYNNTITQTARAASQNGNCIAGYEASYGTKIYNNILTGTPYLYDYVWKFTIELFQQRGLEIYDNTIIGEVDMGQDVRYGTYAYGISFHDNIVGWNTLQSVATNGIQLEQTAEGVYIYNNLFKNLADPVHFCQYKYTDDFVEDVFIYSNIIYNVGESGTTNGWGIRFENGSNEAGCSPPLYYDNINIWNNTILSHASNKGVYGILLPTEANTSGVTNITIKNNIVQGFYSYAVYGYRQDNDYSQAIAGLNISYNDFYGNGYNSALFNGFTPSAYTPAPNITTIPGFNSSIDFNLQSGSGNIWTGVAIGAPVLTDYEGTSFHSPPSIGAFEYSAAGAAIPTVTTTVVTAIEATTATSGGNVTSDGGAAVTARGVCWSTGSNPTTVNSKTSDGTGTGVFTSSITGLTEELTYHVRAYATNSIGTGYGVDRVFTAAAEGKGGETGTIILNGVRGVQWVKISGKITIIE